LEWKKELEKEKLKNGGSASKKPNPVKNICKANFDFLASSSTAGNGIGVDLPNLKDPNRNRALKTIFTVLSSKEARETVEELSPGFQFIEAKILDIAINIERKLWGNTSKVYLKFIRERILILKDKNNPTLKAALILGTVTIDDFVTKEPKDLADEETKKKLEEGIQWSMKA